MTKPPLYGLILTGGRSRRMETNKGAILYHDGIPQQEFEARLIAPFCQKTYLSCRPDQHIESTFPIIQDRHYEIGPIAGILAAFERQPKAAWLVLACDLPYLNTSTIRHLVSGRDTAKIGTCFRHAPSLKVEPLVAIWEPSAFAPLSESIEKGHYSPRRFLQEQNVKYILLNDRFSLTNVNFPSEREQAHQYIMRKKKTFIEGPISSSFIGDAIASHQTKTSIGGHNIFLGRVRADEVDGKTVTAIEFTSYEEMAEEKLAEIREEALATFDVSKVQIYHSLGTIPVGAVCFFVFVSAPHRTNIYEATKHVVNRIKKEVPIFGKELFEAGAFQWKTNR